MAGNFIQRNDNPVLTLQTTPDFSIHVVDRGALRHLFDRLHIERGRPERVNKADDREDAEARQEDPKKPFLPGTAPAWFFLGVGASRTFFRHVGISLKVGTNEKQFGNPLDRRAFSSSTHDELPVFVSAPSLSFPPPTPPFLPSLCASTFFHFSRRSRRARF